MAYVCAWPRHNWQTDEANAAATDTAQRFYARLLFPDTTNIHVFTNEKTQRVESETNFKLNKTNICKRQYPNVCSEAKQQTNISLHLYQPTTNPQVSANNILLLHLGIVNALLCTAFLVFSVPNIARSDGSSAFGAAALCTFHGVLVTTMHPVALWTLCCLNCDRCCAIAAPLHYGDFVNTRRVSFDMLPFNNILESS